QLGTIRCHRLDIYTIPLLELSDYESSSVFLKVIFSQTNS
ncbi:MAG: hypothetical protein ACI9QV_000237, partial [Methylophagaceae bacterium]